MAQEPVEKPWEITSPGYIKFRQMDPMLKTAATLGDVDFFTQAFTSDPPEYFRLRTSNKCNIFHIAVRLRRTAFITKAIEKLELIDLHELLTQQEASLKWNPLHFAAFQGNLEEIQLIHEVYKSIDAASIFVHDLPCLAADVNGKSPLHLALEKNEECALEILSMNTEKLCCLKDNEGRTPFLLAVQQGFTKIASKILESNFKFDISNEDGLNPLQILAENSEECLLQSLDLPQPNNTLLKREISRHQEDKLMMISEIEELRSGGMNDGPKHGIRVAPKSKAFVIVVVILVISLFCMKY
ncbi:hypothetical protein BVRB_4g092400 [Beta vulgaris subsp. vulgaris]|nr:hypothetical protein BVRB_4g092400 [Beta vulgaris subsp. vulgaris]